MRIEYACLFIFAAAATTTSVPWTSDLYGVLLACTGRLLILFRRLENQELTNLQLFSEVVLSGASGFVAHMALIRYTEDPRLVFVACFAAGMVGSGIILSFADVIDRFVLTTIKGWLGTNKGEK